jgi:hypothetical protein
VVCALRLSAALAKSRIMGLLGSLGAPTMRQRQSGITFISFIIIAGFVSSYVFAVLKITPFYLEQMRITRVLNDLKKNQDGNATNLAQIQSMINKRLNVEGVRDMTALDFKIKRSEAGYTVGALYERRADYFGSLSLVVTFDKSVEIIR